ncbi:Myc-type [Macleaya cordata]|uniref:Myc-type n=1 Tax=Macleaya cordata TaxID=56857 RepID=A0A200Q7I6_MACCD|nr:Myc-type [Macleaya cordata]
MNSRIKEVLKCLCCNNGWSYGVFWRVNRQNPMLLTLEDAYFEQQIGIVIDKMLQQVHMLGEGVIGQAAFTGKHRWMFADTYCGEWGPTGSVDNQDVFQDNSQFHQQFSSGIKTIAVISVAPEGVVQFGSTHKILERVDFAGQIRSLFRQPERVEGILLSGNSPALNSETYNPTGVVDSGFSSGTAFSNYWNINAMHSDNCSELMGKTQSAMVLPHSSPFTVGLQIDNMTPVMNNSSLNLRSQFQNAEAGQAISPPPNMQLQHVLSQKPSSSAENSATRYPNMSTWASNLTPFEQQMMSGTGRLETPNTFSANPNSVSCMNTFQNFQGDATSASFETSGLLNTATHTQFLEVNRPIGSSQGNNIQHSIPLIHSTERQLEKGSNNFHTYQGENPVNDLSQFIVQSLEHSNRSISPINESPQTLGVASTSCGLALGDPFSGIPVNDANNTLQNSTNDTVNSLGLGCDGKENSFALPMQLSSDTDLFGSLGLTFGQNQERGCWDDIMLPVGSGGHSNLSNGTSECVSELDAGSVPRPEEDFFAEFEQLLDGGDGNAVCHTNKPSSEDHLSTPTITGAGNASVYGNQTQLAGLSCVGGSMDGLLTNGEPQKKTMHRNQKEAPPRSQVGAWIDDSYGINAEPAVTTQPKKPEEPAKPTRKRARPGESTRPRPKDRQQIQDRVKELRELVPNGGKCSIDALFGRTVKHMVFLESVAKYADKLKQADEPKMIGDESGVVLKDNTSGCGATWAFEVGGKTMVCPIIVEDLNPPGQLLVEMLCEDGGFFLEIADIIRGFGLTILKGVMEVREDKIWARFVVEANRNITRMDIFLSLVQLLQQTATGGISSNDQPSNVVESAVPFTNYQKSPIPLTIGEADRLQ